MPKCQFCHHDNPAGADRCGKCGAWITQGVPQRAAEEPPESSPPPPDDAPRPDPDSLEGQVLALMEASQKIAAVKLYRETTGSGLKEAKDAVEAIAARHGVQPKVAGCSTAILLLAAAWLLLRGTIG